MSDPLSVRSVRRALEAAADSTLAEPMAAYMQHRFVFFGIKTPERRDAVRATIAAAKQADVNDLLDFADACWKEPEREFQYVGSDALKAAHHSLTPAHLLRLRTLIGTKSWWDTVDMLASWPVGSVVSRHPDAGGVMDEWLLDDDFWVARAAILHQLRSKDAIDVERLFRYALARASDTEFFVRKAIGWSLRQYAHRSPDTIADFVAEHTDVLSTLTVREATKNL